MLLGREPGLPGNPPWSVLLSKCSPREQLLLWSFRHLIAKAHTHDLWSPAYLRPSEQLGSERHPDSQGRFQEAPHGLEVMGVGAFLSFRRQSESMPI